MTTHHRQPQLIAHATELNLGIFNQLRFSAQISSNTVISVTIHPASLAVLADILRHTSNLAHACWHFHNRDHPLPCRKCPK